MIKRRNFVRLILSLHEKFLVYLIIFVATVGVSEVQAQEWPFELWHEGKLVLVEGDTLRGLLKYDLQQDLVQYSYKDKTVEAFTARKVLYFEIFDNTVKRYRQFFALPYSMGGDYKAPVFFELLQEGKMTVLVRESLEYRTQSSPYYIGAITRLVLINKFYFLEEDGDIVEFNNNKNDLLNKMGKKANEVEKFMRKNRLRIDDKYDFAKIIEYYNSLMGT